MIRVSHLFSGVLALAVLSALLVGAAPAPASQGMTVGEFVVLVAGQIQSGAGEKGATTPEAAAQVLSKAGVKVKSHLDSPLTNGEAVDLFQQLGITLQARSPETLMGRDRATSLVATFGESFKAPAAPVSLSAGRAMAAPPAMSLEDLNDCQNLPRVKDCHDCCRALGAPNKVCGQACSNSPKASAMEPTP